MTKRVIKVLYVDDEEALLSLGKMFLEKTDELLVETANSAKEAIKLLEHRKFQVIISDYQMPDMDGIQFLKYVNSNFLKRPPFIIFTGKSREEIAIEALNNGAERYVQKGGEAKSQFAVLIDAVKTAYHQKELEDKFKIIHELSMDLSLKDNTQMENLKLIASAVKNVLGISSVAIFLKGDDGSLYPYLLEEFKTDEFKKILIHEGEGLGGMIMETGKGYIINDYHACSEISHIFDNNVMAEGFISVLAVPIRIREDIMGVLYAFYKRSKIFNNEDLDTLSLFGNLAAMEIVRKNKEARIIGERNHYIDFINSLNHIVFETDEDGVIVLVNNFGVRQFGYSVEDVIGRKVMEFVHPEEQEIVSQNIKDLFNRKVERLENKYRIRKRDGSYFVGIISSSVMENYNGIRGLIIDNTNEENLHQGLVLANKKLELINSVTNHDINNALVVVSGCVDLMTDDDVEGCPNQKPLKAIKGAVSAIQNQIRRAKIYQAIGMNSPQWVSFETLFDNCNELYPEIEFVNDIASLQLYADPLFKKALYNLVDNTVRHGQNATKVRISFEKDYSDCISIIYEDDGGGIPDMMKSDIFNCGFGKNTGLGLFLIREILSMTDMKIREVGKLGEGVRFEITVPYGNYSIL
ncbi:MAG: response regulator [Candidatus Pacebacteria bacterium]|nr:response regulator [Candidatus Paceibacterota bacterium]